MHAIDTHCLEKAPELEEAYDRDWVSELALKWAALLNTVANSLVIPCKLALIGRYLRFDPGGEVKRVIEDLLVGSTRLQVFQQSLQVLSCRQLVPVEASDLPQSMHLPGFFQEFFGPYILHEHASHHMSVVWDLARATF